jgi:signal transduction histidine kinase
MLFLVTAVSVFKSYKSYYLYDNEKRINYHSAAIVLNDQLDDMFLYAENISNALATDISKLKNHNAKNIYSILFRYRNIISNNNDLLAWTIFDFVNKDGLIVATSTGGVLKKVIKVSAKDRQWVELAPKFPWRGHLSNLDYGIISGKYIIPYGYGFTDSKNNFLGTISMGINVEKLRSKLIEILGGVGVKFLIFRKDKVNDNIELVFDNIKTKIIKKEVMDYIKLAKDSSSKEISFKLEDTEFKYLHNDKDSNFFVIVGQDSALLNSYIYPRIEQNIILIVFLLMIYLILKKKVINPILALSRISRKIADGDRGVQIPRYDCEELDYLAYQIKKIKKYIGIEEKKEVAQKDSISKTSFLASVSHEIRNPISAIYSIGEILENKESYDLLDEDSKRYFLSEIKNQAEESLSFIQDLLDVGESDSNNLKLDMMQSEDLSQLVTKSVRIVRGNAIRSGIQIEVEIEPELPKIDCDQRKIKQVIVNLLNNSIKYSSENKRIFIKVERLSNREKRKVRLIIQDQGFGMTKSGIKKALAKQPPSNDEGEFDKVDPLGICLYLIKYLVDQHKGSLNIESKIDKGTRVTIDF